MWKGWGPHMQPLPVAFHCCHKVLHKTNLKEKRFGGTGHHGASPPLVSAAHFAFSFLSWGLQLMERLLHSGWVFFTKGFLGGYKIQSSWKSTLVTTTAEGQTQSHSMVGSAGWLRAEVEVKGGDSGGQLWATWSTSFHTQNLAPCRRGVSTGLHLGTA